jgi:D-amino-acid dehydrogenase
MTQAKSVIVLGAGMVGTTAALALRDRGYDVVLVDRNAPGNEASFGNAGIIQGEAREPYALPRDLSSLGRIAFKLDNAVDWDFRGLWRQAPALLSYFNNSTTKRHRRASQIYSELVRRASADHAPLIEASGSERLIRRDGYRLVFRDAASFDLAAGKAEEWRERYGIRFRAEDEKALAAAEPALKRRLGGAIHWKDAWTCSDPGALVKAYALLLQRNGGELLAADVLSVIPQSSGWLVNTSAGALEAAHVVVALGSWSPALVKPLGYSIPMVHKRGYHMHFGYVAEDKAARLDLPLIDAAVGAVYSPMGSGLRIATGADLSTNGGDAMPKQLRYAHARASELLNLGQPLETSAWRGVRPCMPDMLPVVGQASGHPGLWFDFGHGHQGFTLGPTTGALLAAAMSGDLDPIAALSPSRLQPGLGRT